MKTKKFFAYSITALLISTTQLTHAASFDCAKATSKVEKMICSDKELSKLDDQLAQTYKAEQMKTSSADQLKVNQFNWIKTRNQCTDTSCIKTAYVHQLASLKQKSTPLIPFQFDALRSAGTKEDARLKKQCLVLFEKIRTRNGIEEIQPIAESATPNAQLPWLKPYMDCNDRPPRRQILPYFYRFRDSGEMNFKLYQFKPCKQCAEEKWLYGENRDENLHGGFYDYKSQYVRVDTKKCLVTGIMTPYERREPPASNNGIIRINANYYTWMYGKYPDDSQHFIIRKLKYNHHSGGSEEEYICGMIGSVKNLNK